MSGYDENLLKDAPEATRREAQEGYNLALLEEPQASPAPRAPSVPPTGALTSAVPSFPPVAGDPSDNNDPADSPYAKEEEGMTRPDVKTVPFWRTTRGKLILALLAIIVIGAVVGGAVGGTSGKSSSNTAKHSSSSSGNTSPAPLTSSRTTTAGATDLSSQPGGPGVTDTPSSSVTSTAVATSSASSNPHPEFGTGLAAKVYVPAGNAASAADRRRQPLPTGVAAAAEADV